MRQDMERRELEYYLNLRYPVTVHPDPERGFVAEIEELPGCMTQAETLDEIFRAIEDARQLWIKTAYNEGQDIPLPRDVEKYQGKFLVRIPRSLHRDLVRSAKREGVSLNQYVTSLLAAGVSNDIGVFSRFAFMPRVTTLRIFGTTETLLDYGQLRAMPQSQLVWKK